MEFTGNAAIKTAKEYKDLDKSSEMHFDVENSVYLCYSERKYIVMYRVHCNRFKLIGNRYKSIYPVYRFSNLRQAARHYKRLCKYKPLFYA